jgi:signal transduction histidine kinase
MKSAAFESRGEPLCKPDQGMTEALATNILLVDDDPSNIKLLARSLGACGHYRLVSVTDSRNVVELCKQHHFDLIILDLNMPFMDGFQVMSQLRQLKDVDSLCLILVVTAQHDQECRVRALQEGAADYVTKPFQVDELLARVNNLIKVRLYQKHMKMLNQTLETGVRERTEELLRSRQLIRELAAHREKIREEERAHIAREIHDEFGQYLTALRMDAAMLNIRYGGSNEALKQHLLNMKQTIDTTIGVVRNMATALRPGALDMGLVSAAEWLLAGFEERTGIVCRLHATREDLGLDDDRATAAFRILQEALTNITRYAQAKEVDVNIGLVEASLVMVIKDNGVGFNPAEVRSRKTFGLLGIRERALMFGGKSSIESESGSGVILRVEIPLSV